MSDQSLRKRTERAMLCPLAVVVAGVLILAGISAYLMISAQRDEQMRQSAMLVQLLSKHEAAERDHLGSAAPLPKVSLQEDLGVRMEYRVWSDLGPVTQSHGMPSFDRVEQGGFQTIEVAGRRWRIFVLRQTAPDMSVELAEPLEVRLTETALVVLSLAIPLALLVIAVVVIGRRGIASAVNPLSSLSRQIDERHSDDLARIDTAALDREIKPMAHALNRLLARLEEALGRERAFSDNAAHELRTPFATLRLRSQIIAARLKDDPAFAQDALHFQQAIDRAGKIIDGLLCLSRLEHQKRGEMHFDLTACVTDAIAEVSPSAAARSIDLSAELAPSAMMIGDEVAVAMAVRNLLENAVKFTSRAGKVDVMLVAEGDCLELRIRDNGPGLPAGEEQRAFERFYRGTSATPGSGLGLAIVRAVAHLHGGSVHAASVKPAGAEFTLLLTRS